MKEEDPDAHFSFVISEENDLEILFIQTSGMRRFLTNYPNIIYLDGTYCLVDLGFPVYVFFTSDGEMHSNVAAYAIVKDETKLTLTSLLGEFVKLNPEIQAKIETIIMDKDAAEIGAIKTVLPNSNILLCRFHVACNLRDAPIRYCTADDKAQAKYS